MQKTGDCLKYLFYTFSVLLNLFLLYFFLERSDGDLTWTRRPALEAENVASVNCSGHGRAFLDGFRNNGQPVCECYGCYRGADCSDFQPDGCTVHVDSGDPLFLEKFWMQNERLGGVMMSGWHRMGYYMIGENMFSDELERHLRLLHAIVGNANATGKYIVFGVGAMQLLISSVYALSAGSNAAGSPAKVVSNVPYYPAYRLQANSFNGRDFEWHGDASQWENCSDPSTKFIEFVTSPNNPDGHLREPLLKGPNTKVVHDRVYYWPHFTAIPAPADDDVMIFSLGKVTGHAGSRFGWALVKDEAVYRRLKDQVEMNVIGISHDTQLRALILVKSILGKSGRDLFQFGHTTLQHKWQRLNEVVSQSKRFSLQKLSPQYCTYFRTMRQPSPGYAWIKCEREEETDCQEVLKAAGVFGNKGSFFGADRRYARLSLTKSQEDFELMLERIKGLVAEEEGAASI
ncbi:tryptophan aminotransferase-related protein 3-like [Aristolochia californica]|uniref:tryptophan aminotransferase-related protein 3-like n=1 Tax=Aristolochia californica TaxID=171875 RepID=UPI0035E16A26